MKVNSPLDYPIQPYGVRAGAVTPSVSETLGWLGFDFHLFELNQTEKVYRASFYLVLTNRNPPSMTNAAPAVTYRTTVSYYRKLRIREIIRAAEHGYHKVVPMLLDKSAYINV